MPKNFQKYFIAIVPEGELQDKVTDIKLQLKEAFNLKYALKSPAHITLKMPFSWNESKEDRLISQLMQFFKEQPYFKLILFGVGKFGKRVIYIKVREQEELDKLQTSLSLMCKTKLNLKVELSDFAFRPHMTLAFKDLKDQYFEEYLQFLRPIGFQYFLEVKDVALLKRENGKWVVCQRFPLKGKDSVEWA